MEPQPASRLNLIHRHTGDPRRIQRLGPYVMECLVDRGEEGRAKVYRVTIAPGEQTNISFHRIAEEFYFVLSGSGKAILDGKEYLLAAGDFLRLPPGTTHGFITAEEPLELLDIHAPGCRPDRDTYFTDEAPEGFGPG